MASRSSPFVRDGLTRHGVAALALIVAIATSPARAQDAPPAEAPPAEAPPAEAPPPQAPPAEAPPADGEAAAGEDAEGDQAGAAQGTPPATEALPTPPPPGEVPPAEAPTATEPAPTDVASDEIAPARAVGDEPAVEERRLVAYVATGVAVASLAVGITFGVLAQQQYACVSDVLTCNATLEDPIVGAELFDARAEVEHKALIADMAYLFAAAAAVVATTGYVRGFLLTGEEAPTEEAPVSSLPSPAVVVVHAPLQQVGAEVAE